MPKRHEPTPPPKEAVIQIRLDAELARAVSQKAQKYGGTSAVIRALLRRWVKTEGMVSVEDVLAEVVRAMNRPPDETKDAKF